MDLLLICRDASVSSVVDNLSVALEAKKKGNQVAVLFTQEALSAICGGTFGWPRELSGQERRYKMADAATKLGLHAMGTGQARQLDYKPLLEQAQRLQVPMFASSTWVNLLGVQNELPPGVAVLDSSALLKMLMEAKTVIGSL